MKHDYTKERIANTLKELSKAKSLSKITIQDIISACDINRSTFYYHFKDKDDVINWIFKTDVINFCHESKEAEWTHNSYHLLCVFKRDHQFYSQALKIESANSFRRYLYEENFKALDSIIRHALNGRELDAPYLEFLASFYAYAFTESHIRYVTHGAKGSPEKMLQCYYDILEPCIFEALDRIIAHQNDIGMYPIEQLAIESKTDTQAD